MSPMSPQPLNPLELPLQGSLLIEASAGTGKTYTIASLVLRLVLGHGPCLPRAQNQGLLPGSILVMTFTRAATRELADRIRTRLAQAAACFRGQAQPEAKDTFLQGLLVEYTERGERECRIAAWRLASAAQAMDEAAIFTIDAWCQRMLREHAFDSGSLFDEELVASEQALFQQASQDYWRQQVYPLRGADLDAITTLWPSLGALQSELKGAQHLPLPAGHGEGSLIDALARAQTARQAALATFKQTWAQHADAMRDWLQTQLAAKPCPIDKRAGGTLDKWLAAIQAWAERGDDELPFKPNIKAWERLTPTGLQDAWKPDVPFPAPNLPPGFAAFEGLREHYERLPQIKSSLLAHASVNLARRVQQLKQARNQFGFADMLQRLDAALDPALSGDRARRLRERIQAQFPVALIDEFQDTSPIQLRLFDRIYGLADNAPDRALLLIGDPKQAIYGFRGADIYSYLQARQATQGRHFVLGTNYRSTTAVVEGVNAFFLNPEHALGEPRRSQGSFLLGEPSGGAANPVPFHPVRAQGREENLVCSTGPVPAVELAFDATLRAGKHIRRIQAQWCAQRIVTLLNDEQAGFRHPSQEARRLQPGDMAVLVRNGTEARAVRRALQQRGVGSVYLSDKDTVLESAEAQDLLRLMQAVAAPRELRLARAALATGLLARSLPELLRLAQDDAHLDAQLETLASLQQCWQTQGILAMVRRALHAFGIPARLLALPDGERRLTNVLHLGELLQTASRRLDGEQALLRWLQRGIEGTQGGASDPDAQDDERVVRLESDADRVQVITIHKAKGLEYPLVFVPFTALFRDASRDNSSILTMPQTQPDGRVSRVLQLSPSAQDFARKDHERLQEDLRLLYVAMTRARHHLWLGVSMLKIGQSPALRWHSCALGSLLSGGSTSTPEGMAADIARFVQATPAVQLNVLGDLLAPASATEPIGTLPRTPLAPRQPPAPLQDALPYLARFERNWAISSYSALVKGAATAAAAGPSSGATTRPRLREDAPETHEMGRGLGLGLGLPEPLPVPLPAPLPANLAPLEPGSAAAGPEPLAEAPWHRFPKGAYAGNFLHDLLEDLAQSRFALGEAEQTRLKKRCERKGWGHRGEDIQAWLQAIVSTSLPPLGSSLQGLTATLPEMEFWCPIEALDTAQLDALCRQHLYPGRPRPALSTQQLRGLLMGFADLVFEHQGRYGVMDYKSNALGPGDADYTAAAMEHAMLEHRYDVQAALYLLALHRLLRARLGSSYQPEQHLQGAHYFFLRGIASPSAGALHLSAPMALLNALDAAIATSSPEATFGLAAYTAPLDSP